MRIGWTASIAATALLAACSREAPAPGALSADDERRLNEAAEMLDANAAEANALSENEAATDE